ncbi:MAG: hypothetical protein ACKVZH_10810 [Blastocatellia bacterium]
MKTEDRKARELFQQLKHDDRLSAPSFAGMLETVALIGQRKYGGWFRLRAAMAPIAAALVLLMGGWFLRVRQQQVLFPPPLPENVVQSGKLACNCDSELPVQNDKLPKTVRHKRSAPPMPMNVLVSQWRSPTDFLLKTPGQRWLNEAPRLGVPRMEIKSLDLEQKNELEEL